MPNQYQSQQQPHTEQLVNDIKSGSIGIIHLSYLPLCSLRSLWLNHSDATGNNMIRRLRRLRRIHRLHRLHRMHFCYW